MAFSKTIFVLVLVSLEMVSIKPVAAQTAWANFAEMLTSEALLELSKLKIPGLTQNSPSSPSAVIFPAPESDVNTAQQNPIYYYIADAARTIAGQPQATSTTTTKPCGPCGPKPCEPEKVRIVVVTDCDEKKSEESSNSNESTGESHEVFVNPRHNHHFHRLHHF